MQRFILCVFCPRRQSNQLNIDPLCLPNNPTCGENEVALSNFLFCYLVKKEMNCSAPTQEHVLIRVNLRHCARVLLHLLLPSVFQSCPRTRYQQLGPARFSYLRLWRSIRSMYRFNTENAMWTEWCNSRNMRLFWWIWGSWSQKNKEFETAQVTAGREAEREERERVICWWVSCWNCNKGESLAQLHCFLYQWQLPPPPSLFHWMKFPTSSLFTLFTYIPRSNFPPFVFRSLSYCP